MVAGVPGWLDAFLTSPAARWIAALVVLAIGYYVSKLSVRLSGRRVARRFQRPSVTRTVLRFERLAVLTVAVLVAMAFAGVGIPNIVLSVTVFSAVLGIVLAPIVGSFINGFFVLADQPYEIGDMIELVDREERGFVEDITLRYTKVFTLDNTFLVISNSAMRERDVVNYSAEDERTRRSLELLVTYEGDLDEARDLMEAAAREVDEVIEGGPDIRVGSARYPAEPRSFIRTYADSGVLLVLRYWVRNPYYLTRVESKVQERVWERLDDADVVIAYPHTHLVFDDTSGIARVAVGDDQSPAPGPPAGVDDSRALDQRSQDATAGDDAPQETAGKATRSSPDERPDRSG